MTALPNGNYVVVSPFWDNGASVDAGAVTWGSGTTGVSGVVSAANSLVGSTANDDVGSGGVTALSNGNYVVASPSWDNGAVADAGAATWGSGTTGVSGVVSAANSLVGSTAGDVGRQWRDRAHQRQLRGRAAPVWDNGAVANAGAATWGSGTTGVSGVVSAANSLVGSHGQRSGRQRRRDGAHQWQLRGQQPDWDNGAIANAGAATWGSGTTGVTGAVSAANSLVGSTANDEVGSGGVTALTNGNYVVMQPALGQRRQSSDAGAVTWGSGTTGVTGGLRRQQPGRLDGQRSSRQRRCDGAHERQLRGRSSPFWDNGAVANAGAVTWGSGTTGVSGVVSAANSLVGSTASDQVGGGGVTALTNGNYVVVQPELGQRRRRQRGCGDLGQRHDRRQRRGLRRQQPGRLHGQRSGRQRVVTALSNGNYVVSSPNWDNGAVVNAGAATWGSGTTGVSGAVSAANSLVGSTANDQVGGNGVTALTNGNYVVAARPGTTARSSTPARRPGAAARPGVTGAVSAANSLVGSTANDHRRQWRDGADERQLRGHQPELGQRRRRQRGRGDLGQRHDAGRYIRTR